MESTSTCRCLTRPGETGRWVVKPRELAPIGARGQHAEFDRRRKVAAAAVSGTRSGSSVTRHVSGPSWRPTARSWRYWRGTVMGPPVSGWTGEAPRPQRARRRGTMGSGCTRGTLPCGVKGRVAVAAAARPAFIDFRRVLVHRLPPHGTRSSIRPRSTAIGHAINPWLTPGRCHAQEVQKGHARARHRGAEATQGHQRRRNGAHASIFG